MHISGESLLNDGSAVVFYTIFSQRFFYELGIKDFGSDIGWDDGFGWFFRLSVRNELFCRFFGHHTKTYARFPCSPLVVRGCCYWVGIRAGYNRVTENA